MSRIEHEGRVVAVTGDTVRVEVEAGEACGTCAARRQCVMGQVSNSRTITVATGDAATFRTGERVMVASQGKVGAMAVVLGYVVPLVVMLATLVAAICAGVGERIAAIVSIAAIALYYAALYLLRRTISKKVNFTISRTE